MLVCRLDDAGFASVPFRQISPARPPPSRPDGMSGEPTPTTVRLHLYDLSQGMARAMSAQLLGKQLDGVWHTGIVAFGQEFYFGGGIQCGTPGHTHFGRPMQVIDLGATHIPREVFDEFLVDIAPRFTMQTYNLLRHNCNNFSDEVAQFLVGEGIPRHIVDLPNEVMNTPFGQQLMPMLSMMDAQMRTVSEGVEDTWRVDAPDERRGGARG